MKLIMLLFLVFFIFGCVNRDFSNITSNSKYFVDPYGNCFIIVNDYPGASNVLISWVPNCPIGSGNKSKEGCNNLQESNTVNKKNNSGVNTSTPIKPGISTSGKPGVRLGNSPFVLTFGGKIKPGFGF